MWTVFLIFLISNKTLLLQPAFTLHADTWRSICRSRECQTLQSQYYNILCPPCNKCLRSEIAKASQRCLSITSFSPWHQPSHVTLSVSNCYCRHDGCHWSRYKSDWWVLAWILSDRVWFLSSFFNLEPQMKNDWIILVKGSLVVRTHSVWIQFAPYEMSKRVCICISVTETQNGCSYFDLVHKG